MIDVELFHEFPNFTLDVNFTCQSELTVLFGPSGVGKSLTVRAIAGLFVPQKGHVRVNGDVWFDSETGILVPPQQRKVGYVPQHYGLFPHMTVAENIAFGIRRVSQAERRQRVAEMLALMHLQGLEERYPRELSGGQQQRVALARALVIQPRVLLLDEALGALDPALREELQEQLRLVQQRYKLPVLLITHDLQEAYALASQLVVFEAGQVVQVGSQEDVFRHPATVNVARAVGMRNLFEGRVLRHTLDSTELVWPGGTLLVSRVDFDVGQEIVFGFRPEDVLFVREQRPLRQQHNIVDVKICEEHPTGFDHLLVLELVNDPEVVIYARLPRVFMSNLGIRPGQRRRILIRRRTVHVFGTSKLRHSVVQQAPREMVRFEQAPSP